VATAPAAIVLREPDLILAIGAAVAEELYDVRIPVLVVDEATYPGIVDGEPFEVPAFDASGRPPAADRG
jgi:predicted aconitase with swiveling domain